MTLAAPPIRLCAFDAYGTLFDVHAAVRRAGQALGERAAEVSAAWRAKQLEYTWTYSLAGRYRDFWALTEDALDHALAQAGGTDPATRTALLEAYRVLDAFPDALPVLKRLKAAGFATAILSNGTPGMLADAVASAGLGDQLDAVLSVDPLRQYKPDPKVYTLAVEHFALPREAIVFLSANSWDATGAALFGLRVFWLNRTGARWDYGALADPPVIGDLTSLPDLLTPPAS